MEISKKQLQQVDEILSRLTVEELVGQVMNINVTPSTLADIKTQIPKLRPGAVFVNGLDKDMLQEIVAEVNKYSQVPVIVCADVENGGCACLKGNYLPPDPMTWGACNDEALIEKLGRVTGEMCRKSGIHWNFSPVVDINYNKDNPVTHVRAISDSPQQVAKIASAYVRGMQTNGMMIAGSKHFPGDGLDDRNQHFCTTINSFPLDKWMETYGYVYKKMFEAGTASVMVGHIALPAIEDEIDPILGPKPGTLSSNIMVKLLRQTLGYDGCIVSDAMSMIGACAVCEPDRLAIEFFKAGGDILLFALERDFDCVLAAVQSGELPLERLKDAVRNVLIMKMRARLFEDQAALLEGVGSSGDILQISQEIAQRSIKVVRNAQGLVPLKLKPNAKFLLIYITDFSPERRSPAFLKKLNIVAEELRNRGYEVDTAMAYDIDHYWVNSVKANYDCILFVSDIGRGYLGGTLRITRNNIMPFWRGAALDHPCTIFASMGDPYKLYDFPYLKTYINGFSGQTASMKALVRVLLGEIQPTAKNPVALPGFFEREV